MIKRAFYIILTVFLFAGVSYAQNIKLLFNHASKSNDNFEIILNLAKNGNIEAAYYAGLAYEIGKGVELNYKRAADWYKKAANSGWIEAQYNLAFMYKYGYGVKRNMIESYKWFYIVGDKDECYFDSQIMSKEQVKEAIKLAKEWLIKYQSS